MLQASLSLLILVIAAEVATSDVQLDTASGWRIDKTPNSELNEALCTGVGAVIVWLSNRKASASS